MHLFLGHCGLIFAIGLPFLTNLGGPQPLNGMGKGGGDR